MATTIKDVAKKANVSITTVSKIINGKADDISKSTIERVQSVIDELNYKPNRLARSMILKKTKTVGLIIPDVQNPFFTKMVRGAEDAANEREYNIFFCNTDDDIGKEISYMNMLIEKSVDGIVLVGAAHRDKIKEKEMELKLPIVTVDRDVNFENIDATVSVDNFIGAYEAVKHLIGLGHKEIVYISGSLGIKPTKDRMSGYVKALEDSGFKLDDNNIYHGDYTSEFGEEIVNKIVGLENKTAIFCGNDMIALGVLKSLKRKGIRVPEDISIVGYDDIDLVSLISPELTTISQPSYELGKKSMNVLIDIIEKENEYLEDTILETNLIIRESTKKISDTVLCRRK